jgi:hypothetical protein
MTDIIDEEEIPKRNLLQRSGSIVQATMLFASPIISIGCAIIVGYFAYMAANQKPPEDMFSLAISILKSGDASPEMRSWATGVLRMQTDIPMPARFSEQ